MDTEKDTDQQISDNRDEPVAEASEKPGLSRRKFNRNVLVGSAVLLTLSNRSAWGTKELICASASLLESYNHANPSRLTEEQLNEIYDYESYYSERKNDPVLIDGDMCYERNTSNQNTQLSTRSYWFE